MSALVFAHMALLHTSNAEIFATITGLSGTVIGLFVVQKTWTKGSAILPWNSLCIQERTSRKQNISSDAKTCNHKDWHKRTAKNNSIHVSVQAATVELQETGLEVSVMVLLGNTTTRYIYIYAQLAFVYFGGVHKYVSVWVTDRDQETKLSDEGYQLVRRDPRDGACLYRKLDTTAAKINWTRLTWTKNKNISPTNITQGKATLDLFNITKGASPTESMYLRS
jgi:hypothetical protein